MLIEKNKAGIIAYSIRVNDAQGELLEEATTALPRTMIFGSGRIMKSFEDKLIGLRSGDNFEFVLAPSESFGEYNNDMRMELPKSVFMVNGQIKPDTLVVGRVIPMMDGEGNPFDGRVLAVNDDSVSMDFNHPLAGKKLFVKGEVMNVREATYEELYPVASGCGCGSHNDSCCGGGGHHHDEEEGCGVCGDHGGHHHHGGGCSC